VVKLIEVLEKKTLQAGHFLESSLLMILYYLIWKVCKELPQIFLEMTALPVLLLVAWSEELLVVG
jgi:hypothetical protein